MAVINQLSIENRTKTPIFEKSGGFSSWKEGFDSPRGCQFERTACRPVIYNNRWPLFLPKNGKVTSEVTSSPIWFYAVPLESDSPDSIFFTPSL